MVADYGPPRFSLGLVNTLVHQGGLVNIDALERLLDTGRELGLFEVSDE